MLNLKNGNKLLLTILFCLFSFGAGAINGFIGTGGGILMVFMLNILTKNDKKDNFSTTLLSIVPISIIGLYAYFVAGSVDFSILSRASLPALFGGALGAFLMDKLKVKWLNIIFGALVIYSGVKMIL
ncbi:MAG: sulfite exporter TauE/SafE family protein [Clostridia bacterium]|nr:sulfite exporter TauE/SafE family protein [Clostridia bacterium]